MKESRFVIVAFKIAPKQATNLSTETPSGVD
jgi:hypothetical protein